MDVPMQRDSVTLAKLPSGMRGAFLAALNDGRCVTCSSNQERSRCNHLVESGVLVRPFPGIYAPSDIWANETAYTHEYQVIRALGRAHPDWVFWGPSAAVVHGLAISYRYLDSIHLSTGRAHLKNTRYIIQHADGVRDVVRVGGVAVTTFERTVADCMRYLPFAHALAIADSALRIKHAGNYWLLGLLQANARGRVNVGHAFLAAPYADGRAENGGESVARASMIQLGFALPELQVEVPYPIEGGTKRVDFYWELDGRRSVIGELDGRGKYLEHPTDAPGNQPADGYVVSRLSDERIRESRLSAQASIMRFTPRQAGNLDYMEKVMTGFDITRERGREILEGRKKIPNWARGNLNCP